MGNKIGRKRQVVDEKYTKPQGRYLLRDIDHKKLRKLILDAKLAPCYPGDDDCCTLDLEECPICYLYYPSLNRSKCCTKGICTECFLQMKPSDSTRSSQCPFCKTPNYAVEYRGAKTMEEKGLEQVEEQRVIEAKIRMQQKELQTENECLNRKEESNISSRIIPLAEVEYQDVSNSSYSATCFRYSTQDDEVVSSQGSCSVSISARPSHSRQYGEGIDIDLEDEMIMEAIRLSIQEQGMPRFSSTTGFGNSPALPIPSQAHFSSNTTLPLEASPSYGLAYAVISLPPQPLTADTCLHVSNLQHCTASFPPREERPIGHHHTGETWIEDLDEHRRLPNEQNRWLVLNHRSNALAAETSYTSSSIMVDTRLPAQLLHGVCSASLPFLPAGFDNQMMQSMCMEDVASRINTHGLTWL